MKLPVDKALFLIDMLEMGRRKYTQLRQTLLTENINFISFAAKECEQNMRIFMKDLINLETEKLQNGISLENGIL